MKLYDLLQFSVCVFSILAAGFWLRSATTTLPNLTENLRWDGTGAFPDALKSQSRWSAAGAACAGMAALSQSLSVVLPYLDSRWHTTKPCTNSTVQGLDVSCDPLPNAMASNHKINCWPTRSSDSASDGRCWCT